jgi:hypothetical protein
MLGPVGIEPAPPIRVTQPTSRSSAAEESIRTAPSPQVQVAVSQILMNAESLFASVIGVRANDISISVNVGRYEF